MTSRRNVRITRRSAARALDQAGTSGAESVDRILSAAAAPATAAELSGEAVTAAMFRAAVPVAAPAPRASWQTTTTKRLAAGRYAVAGAAALTLSTGGIALAASTGHLPFENSHRSATGASHSSQAPGQTGIRPSHPAHPTNGPTDHASGSPSPSLRGLCHAYQAGAGTSNGKNLSNPAFTALATAAGGKASIAAYCTALIGAPGSHPTHPAKPTHTAHPTHPAKPTTGATPTHSAHPTHPAHPTNSPSPHSHH